MFKGMQTSNNAEIKGFLSAYSTGGAKIRSTSCSAATSVYPDSVEPLAVCVCKKFIPADGIDVLRDCYDIHCPNCDRLLGDTSGDETYEMYAYCPGCGMGLSWGNLDD